MPSSNSSTLNDKVHRIWSIKPSPQNRAFRYGDGLFETILVRNGLAFHENLHLNRMALGMAVLGFAFDPEMWKEKMKNVVHELIRHCVKHEFARIRIQVYRGGMGAYLPAHDCPEFYAEITPLEKDPWEKPPSAKIGMFATIPLSYSVLSAVKSANALPYILAARHAKQQAWDDALLCASTGNLAESSRANLFWLAKGILNTPKLETGCLPGIMRQAVIDAAEALGFPLQEVALPPLSLQAADEIFLTNVIRGLMPVHKLAESKWKPSQDKVRTLLFEEIRKHAQSH